jgi:hypothetical protein
MAAVSNVEGIDARLNDDTPCTLLSRDGEFIKLVTSIALPPGRPTQVHVPDDQGLLNVPCRCVGSRKLQDERFEVRLRIQNLRKDERARLHTLLP